MNVRKGIETGRRIIAEQNIDIDAAKMAMKSMHPNVPSDQLEIAVIIQVASISELRAPFTVDSVAEQMADKSGAFPWAGPVGNGLSLDHYRDKFRDMARDALFLREVIGLDAGEAGR